MSDINVTVSSGSSAVSVSVGTAFQAQIPSLMVEAGANITVTTASASFTIVGPIGGVPISYIFGG
jgi:hypothetical protein